MKLKTALVLSTLTLALIACQKQQTPQKVEATPAEQTAAVQVEKFDIHQFALSSEKLGKFPFFNLPDNLIADANTTIPNLSKFPLFIKGSTHWIEGTISAFPFKYADGKTVVSNDVKIYFADAVKKLGGQEVSAEQIPADILAQWAKEGVGKEVLDQFMAQGANNSTYLIRHADGNVWLNLLTHTQGGMYVVAQEKSDATANDEQTKKLAKETEERAKLEADEKAKVEADAKAKAEADKAKVEADAKAKAEADKAKVEADAKAKAEADKAKVEAKSQANEKPVETVNATALKQELDKDGNIALDIRFVSGQSQIDSTSKAQIEQVAKYLKDNTDIKLSVNGHTDNTGRPANNKTLSEKRAKAVVDALVAQGVDASRLTAKGFGSTKPIADNKTKEGQQQNRRVELVKIK